MSIYVHSIRVRATNNSTHKDWFERRYIILLPVSVAINAVVLFAILKICG